MISKKTKEIQEAQSKRLFAKKFIKKVNELQKDISSSNKSRSKYDGVALRK